MNMCHNCYLKMTKTDRGNDNISHLMYTDVNSSNLSCNKPQTLLPHYESSGAVTVLMYSKKCDAHSFNEAKK